MPDLLREPRAGMSRPLTLVRCGCAVSIPLQPGDPFPTETRHLQDADMRLESKHSPFPVKPCRAFIPRRVAQIAPCPIPSHLVNCARYWA